MNTFQTNSAELVRLRGLLSSLQTENRQLREASARQAERLAVYVQRDKVDLATSHRVSELEIALGSDGLARFAAGIQLPVSEASEPTGENDDLTSAMGSPGLAKFAAGIVMPVSK